MDDVMVWRICEQGQAIHHPSAIFECVSPTWSDAKHGTLYAGFPIGVSYPHFYQADPMLVEAVEGSYPDMLKHESYFYIEPVSP
jgi:hypothetical protein